MPSIPALQILVVAKRYIKHELYPNLPKKNSLRTEPTICNRYKSEYIMFFPVRSPGPSIARWVNNSCRSISSKVIRNKSPKGHWSLTWVQWALLLKVRFLSKSESMTAIFVKSVRTATIAKFQFRIRGCIRFVAVAFQSEEKVLWRRNPSLTYFWQIPPPPPTGSAPGWSLSKSLWTGAWLWVLHLYQVS